MRPFLHAAARKNREKKRTASQMMWQSFEAEKIIGVVVQAYTDHFRAAPLLQGAIAYHLNDRFNGKL
jgi:hypothetical protein